jgi:hypothetical protein
MRYFRYRLFLEDGSDVGEASYAVLIQAGEFIHLDRGQRIRVLDVVAIEEEDAPFVGLLKVAPN